MNEEYTPSSLRKTRRESLSYDFPEDQKSSDKQSGSKAEHIRVHQQLRTDSTGE